MAVLEIDVRQGQQRHHDHLDGLTARDPQGQLREEVVVAADAGEAVMVVGVALEGDEEDQNSGGAECAVEQDLRVAQLEQRERKNEGQQAAHDVHHVGGDAAAVAEEADCQHQQFQKEKAVADLVQGTPLVVAVFVKVEQQAGEGRGQRQGCKGCRQGHQDPPGGAQAPGAVHMFQNQYQQEIGEQGAHGGAEQEIQGVEGHVHPQGDRVRPGQSEHTQDIQQDGSPGREEAE